LISSFKASMFVQFQGEIGLEGACQSARGDGQGDVR